VGADITHVTTFRPARGTAITQGQAAHQIDGKTGEHIGIPSKIRTLKHQDHIKFVESED